MTDAPAIAPIADQVPVGIVCRQCGAARWKVTHTRPGSGCVRRWRACLGCRAVVRTAERIEAEAHPERDAG